MGSWAYLNGVLGSSPYKSSQTYPVKVTQPPP